MTTLETVKHTTKRARKPLTPERIALFLDELRRLGIVAEAARVASPASRFPSGAVQTFYDARRNDASLAAQWDDAVHSRDDCLAAVSHFLHFAC